MERMSTIIIPYELARFAMSETQYNGSWCAVRNEGYNTRIYRKPIALYLLLKSQAPESGWILDYAKQIPELAIAFGISRSSFYNYVAKLEDIGIAERIGTKLRLAGWEDVGEKLMIDTSSKTEIQYQLYGKFNLPLWLSAVSIEANQLLQFETLWRKLNENSGAKQDLLEELCRNGFHFENQNDPEKFINALFLLYIKDFATGTDVHETLIQFRPDLNRAVTTIATDWRMTPSLVCYLKRKMKDSKIISITKNTVMSEYRLITKACHMNKNCHVIWNKKAQERVWFLCDQITVLRPWTWSGLASKKLTA